MRISDWSSDVCSSDLCGNAHGGDAYTDHHFLRRRLRALLDRVQDALEAVEDHGGRSKHPRSADKPGSAITRAPERLHILRRAEIELDTDGDKDDQQKRDREDGLKRTEERRGGKEGVSTCRSRWSAEQ